MHIQDITEPKTWQRLTNQTRAPLAQRWIYGAAAQAIGRDVRRIAIFEGTALLGSAQIIMRTFAGVNFALITHGPALISACPKEINSQLLLKELKKSTAPCTVTIMTPEHQYRRMRLSKRSMLCELDLTPQLSDLRAQLHPKWRNALKKSEKSGLKVAQLTATPRALGPLLRFEKERQSQNNYKALPPEFALALQQAAPRDLYLWQAADAYMLFIHHGNSATYYMGCTGDQGRSLKAHNLIMWTAIQKLKSLGVERLDLGTVDLKNAPDLARFKTRSGAKIRSIGSAQKL